MPAIALSKVEIDLLDGCYSGDPGALAALSALPANAAICEYLLESSLQNDLRCLTILRSLPRDCAVYLMISRHRTDRLLALFENTVRSAYRHTLARFPGEFDDAIQQFWAEMAAGGALNFCFDPLRGSEEKSYIFGVARNRALRYLTRMLRRAEVPLDAVHEPVIMPPEPNRRNDEAWLVGDLCRLLLSNQLEVHHAVVLLLKTLSNIGPSKLAASYLQSSLLSLVLLLERSTDANGMSLAPLWQALRYQMELPAYHPLGLVTLEELARSSNHTDAREVIQRWLTEALRVCQRTFGGVAANMAEIISQRATANYRRNVNGRVAFLDQSTRENKTLPIAGLLWAWRHMFGVHAEWISAFTCEQATEHWEARVRFVGCGPVPEELVALLAGPPTRDTIGERIASERLDPERLVRNLEDRYRRAQAEGS